MNETTNLKLPAKVARGARPHRFRTLLRVVAVGLVLILIWCGSLYYRITSFTGVSGNADAVRADAGIVLGASLWNDKPSPGLRERLDHALALFRAGVFPHLIVSGGLDAGGAKLTEAEGMRDYLQEKGVPAEAIEMDTQSHSTYENLLFSRNIMKEKGWQSAVIVTHRYHGARAADIAETLGYKPVQVSVTDSKVMNMAYHETREILAFTKWELDKLRLTFGY
jgi:uncharacterized SAM-binding protein YcdF (DUF218 family)